jgi:hypothetical protein
MHVLYACDWLLILLLGMRAHPSMPRLEQQELMLLLFASDLAAASVAAAVLPVVRCAGLPPTPDNAAEGGWNSSCSNATAGSICSLTCAADSTCDGYQAVCTASGNWSVNGTCECERLHWVLSHACVVCL